MNLINRATNIIMKPATEWPVIAGESTPVAQLYTGYIMPLSAIGAIASFFGVTMVGVTLPMIGTHRVSMAAGLISTVLAFVLSLAMVYVIALIIDALAPNFEGEKNMAQALKLAAYCQTPAWVAGILRVVPLLSLLILLASAYGIYLLYLGLPVLMKCPKEKAVAYTVVIVVCAIVLSIILGVVVAAVTGFGAAAAG